MAREIKGLKQYVGVYREVFNGKFVLKVKGDDVYLLAEADQLPEGEEAEMFIANDDEYFWDEWASLDQFHHYWGDDRVEDATLTHFNNLEDSLEWLIE